MTAFEKSVFIQVGLAGIIGAIALIWGTIEIRFSIIPWCFAWSGAAFMWTQLADRNGQPKKTLEGEGREPAMFVLPIACAFGAVLFMAFAALPVIVIAYLIGSL